MSSSPTRPRRLLLLTSWALALPIGGAAVLTGAPGGATPVVRAHAAAPAVEARSDLDRLPNPGTSTTAAPTTSTTVPTTTTTTPPPPPPTPPTMPTPPPPAAAAPAPAPAPAASGTPSADQVYREVVPAAWRSVFGVRFEYIGGGTSWASSNGTISIAAAHRANRSVLAVTIAHEFGHLIAWRYGTQAYNGAAPEGWPAYTSRPEEAWSDCVSQVFTGITDPSHGLPACAGSSLSWTRTWLGSGPGSHPVTG